MQRSSSSDSDNGERIKNVRHTSIKTRDDQQNADKTYIYKRKLGDLIFDAHFEAGNLGFVDQVDEYEFDLMVRPDVCSPRHHLWFNFIVSNQRPDQCVIFNLVNLSEAVKLFNDGLTPVVRSKQNPNWLRMHEDQVFYYQSTAHGNRYILSLSFKFSTYDDPHQFALFYPYEFTRLTSFISRWTIQLDRRRLIEHSKAREQKALKMRRMQSPDLLFNSKGTKTDSADNDCPRLGQALLGTSVLNRPIQLLSVRCGLENSSFARTKVLIACRPCGNLDGPASLVCQGVMDFTLSDDTLARVARQKIDFDFAPMLDPDSIVAGNSRTDILGQLPALSKSLINKNPVIYAHLIELQKHVLNLSSVPWNRVVFIELKVNINLIGARILGSVFEDNLRMERHLALPRLMTHYASDFYLENCEFHKPGEGPSSSFNFVGIDQLDHYRLEISPYAAFKRTILRREYDEYSQEKYLSLGKALVYSLLATLGSQRNLHDLPKGIFDVLDSFHPCAQDIDNLVLSDKVNM